VPHTAAAKANRRILVVSAWGQRPDDHEPAGQEAGYESAVVLGITTPICNKYDSCPDLKSYLAMTSALYRGSSSKSRNHQLEVVWVVSAREILRSGFAAR